VLKKDMGTGIIALERFAANPSSELDRQRGVKAAELLAKMGVDEVWIRSTLNGKGAGYALEALGIAVLATGATVLRELLSDTTKDLDGITMESPSLSSRTA
jgi:predicted Fe-Mo cluster-binding NifX family protein